MAINGPLHTYNVLKGPKWTGCKVQNFSAYLLDRPNLLCYDDLHVAGAARVKIMWAGNHENEHVHVDHLSGSRG